MNLLEAATAAHDEYLIELRDDKAKAEDEDGERIRDAISKTLGHEWALKAEIKVGPPPMEMVYAEVDGVAFVVRKWGIQADGWGPSLHMLWICPVCGEACTSDEIVSLRVLTPANEEDWKQHYCPKPPPPLQHKVFCRTEQGAGEAIGITLTALALWQRDHPNIIIEHESTVLAHFLADDVWWSTYALTIAYRESAP